MRPAVFARSLALGGVALLALGHGAARADKIRNPTAVFAGLDKITGRIIAFEAAVDETVQFGSLQLTARVCYSRPEYENPQTTTFVEVEEVTLDNQYRKIFSGWMFAASPGLNAIEHPVYDIWLSDCKGGKDIIKSPPDLEDEITPAQPVLEVKKSPRSLQPLAPRNSATSAPLRLPGGDAPQAAPRAQPQQRFFPTNAPPPFRGGYEPGPKN